MWNRVTILLLFFTILANAGRAQVVFVKGIVKDAHNEEPIPFASVELNGVKRGTVTDTAGYFYLEYPKGKSDSVVITYVGYKRKAQLIINNEKPVIIMLERAEGQNATIKTKANWGLILWRKVVKHKPANDRRRYSSYAYELHNKLELDLNRVNKERLKDIKLLKPFDFVLKNVDSSEGTPILPIFLTETLSEFYFQRTPKRTREVIKASKTNGINNESVTKLLGGMYQNVNVYDNFIPVFDKQFISPLSDNGDAYYNYSVPDTQKVNGRTYYHWVFSAKHKGFNTFEGDAWVHDSTYAIQRIQLRLTGNSTVNFIENLSIYQDYKLLNDSVWFLSKDKFIADVYPAGKNKFGMKGRKTSTYRNISVNKPFIGREIDKNKLTEEVVVMPDAEQKTDTFWSAGRHEELNKNEQAIYHMLDTLQQMPIFKKYTNTISFITTGYKAIGNYEIGPWFNWVSTNTWEGLRARFDLGTTPGFNKNMYLHGYLAYGFGDRKFKGKAEMYYFLDKNPRKYLHLSVLKDMDNGQYYYDEVSLDNIFSLAIRKKGIPMKFMKVEMQQVEYFTSSLNGFSVKLTGQHKVFEPLLNLPLKGNFKAGQGDPLNNFETSVAVRFAYLERFLEGNYFRTSLGSDYPIIELKYSKGWSGIFKSNYDYHKLSVRVNDFIKIPPYGNIDYAVYAGKVFGTLPYMLLEVAPGNEIYYYNKYAFNLMNRFEYINDRYAGFSLEHNIGNGIFKYTSLTRKLRFRQFWNIKTLVGGLSQANKDLNFVPDHPFKSLDGKVYAELGTGVDNIFKVFRLDLIWRLGPRPLPENKVARFGVFGSFRLAF
ncbi:DUF5686 and carboxypeptidase-like regulatory domain-containing protein [soil metagenome]